MFADHRSSNASFFARSGPMLAVIGVHVLLGYVLTVSMGIVELPTFAQPIEAVFIPEQQDTKPEPEIPVVKPEIADVQPQDQPPPEIDFDEPVVPPSDTAIPASENAISAVAAAPTAQDLKTSSRSEPIYPPVSRRMGEQGTVKLRVLVDERGRPGDVNVLASSGFSRLDQAAIEAVRKWRFVAATNGERSITAWTQVAVTFRLTDA